MNVQNMPPDKFERLFSDVSRTFRNRVRDFSRLNVRTSSKDVTALRILLESLIKAKKADISAQHLTRLIISTKVQNSPLNQEFLPANMQTNTRANPFNDPFPFIHNFRHWHTFRYLYYMTSPQKPFSVLIAEDNPHELNLLHLAMEEANLLPLVDIHIARDGEEALDALQGSGIAFDLVLLDLNMPRVSGKEVLATARQDTLLNGTRIIILSNSDMHEDMEDCFHLRADAYVQKPARFDRLVNFCEAVRDSIMEQGKICTDFIRHRYAFVETA